MTRFIKGDRPGLEPLPGYAPNIGHATDGGGLQQHSIGGPFPFVLVGIDNPTGLEPGLYWYVQDKTGKRCSVHTKDCNLAANWAAYNARKHPDGNAPWPTPLLQDSDGYIQPKPVTVTLTAEEAAHFQAVFDGGGYIPAIMSIKQQLKDRDVV